jgi:two-component system, OmpR family, response regulator
MASAVSLAPADALSSNARMQDRPHILVVDDDREIRRLLGDYLEKNGYRSSAVPDGKGMRRALEMSPPNLIVLDLMLPGDGGLALCREIRSHSQVPIVMLTALGDEPDRILGFECGADDYVVKPFNPRELLVRIRAVLRRAAHAPRDPDTSEVSAYRFAGWRLDTTTRVLTRPDGTDTALNGAEYRLLSILLSHPGRVLSRIQIMELARGRDLDPFDRSIDVRISRLRQRLGDDARSASIIKTVYGEGYVVGVPVESE